MAVTRGRKLGIEERYRRMSSVRSRDTAPEMAVRSLLHRRGFRFRVNVPSLPGKPDIVFSARKAVVFVHGCFWHSHGCKYCRLPESNRSYWKPKLERNRERDRSNKASLERLGWQVLVVWECELREPRALEGKLVRFLGTPKHKTLE